MVYIRKGVNKWERVEKELNRRSHPEKKVTMKETKVLKMDGTKALSLPTLLLRIRGIMDLSGIFILKQRVQTRTWIKLPSLWTSVVTVITQQIGSS